MNLKWWKKNKIDATLVEQMRRVAATPVICSKQGLILSYREKDLQKQEPELRVAQSSRQGTRTMCVTFVFHDGYTQSFLASAFIGIRDINSQVQRYVTNDPYGFSTFASGCSVFVEAL